MSIPHIDMVVFKAVAHVEVGDVVRIPMNPNRPEMTVVRAEVESIDSEVLVTTDGGDDQAIILRVRGSDAKATFSIIRFVWEWIEVIQ